MVMDDRLTMESQKDEPSGYDLLDRAVFYVSRLIFSQKERDFVHTNYNDIRRVFSIWACMNLDENSMGYVRLAHRGLPVQSEDAFAEHRANWPVKQYKIPAETDIRKWRVCAT